MQPFRTVFLCLPLDADGLAACTTDEEVQEVVRSFCENLQLAVFLLRGKMRGDARLVLGGPYPNEKYSEIHRRALEQVWCAVRSLDEVDSYVDFLQPVVHDGHGRWAEG